MKHTKIILFSLLSMCFLKLVAQDYPNDPEFTLISSCIMEYIEGTSNGEPERLEKAFHPDFNLYSVTAEDSLKIWKGKDYIDGIKVGKKNSRIGRIISIDYENNAAIAKAEIKIPGWRIFTDYFLLLKYEGTWKIVHKSYSWQEIGK